MVASHLWTRSLKKHPSEWKAPAQCFLYCFNLFSGVRSKPPTYVALEAIASRSEAIASRLEAGAGVLTVRKLVWRADPAASPLCSSRQPSSLTVKNRRRFQATPEFRLIMLSMRGGSSVFFRLQIGLGTTSKEWVRSTSSPCS